MFIELLKFNIITIVYSNINAGPVKNRRNKHKPLAREKYLSCQKLTSLMCCDKS